jgi:hypothetical protein
MTGTRTYLADRLGAIGRPHRERKRSGPHDVARDVGCLGIARSCLQCPLPACRFELPREESHRMVADYLDWKQRQQRKRSEKTGA